MKELSFENNNQKNSAVEKELQEKKAVSEDLFKHEVDKIMGKIENIPTAGA